MVRVQAGKRWFTGIFQNENRWEESAPPGLFHAVEGGGTVWAVCRHSRHHMPSFTSGLLLHNHSHARFKGHHVYSQLQHTQAGLAHTRNPVPDLILGIWPGYLSLATITSFAPSLGLFCFSTQTLSTCEVRTTATLVTGQGREGKGRQFGGRVWSASLSLLLPLGS